MVRSDVPVLSVSSVFGEVLRHRDFGDEFAWLYLVRRRP
jgi:hypothetical protein